MNTAIIRQILEESKAIPDEILNFSTWWSSSDGVETMCPMGRHVLNHPELVETLRVRYEEMTYMGKREIRMRISTHSTKEYLGISYEEYELLFCNPNLTRDQFIKWTEQLIDGEICVRACSYGPCDTVYISTNDDTSCVCEDCKETLLEMCGV